MSLSEASKNELKILKDNFLKVTKRVLKEKVSINPDKLKQYEQDLIKHYNEFISCICTIFAQSNQQTKATLKELFIYIRDKAIRCFGVIKSNAQVPINLNTHIKIPNNLTIIPEKSSSSEEEIDQDDIEINNISEPNPDSDPDSEHNDTNMGDLTVSEFLRLSAQTINRNFSGDPLILTSFIDSVRLLESLATTNELRGLLLTFVKTKIDGRAREYILDTHTTLDSILNVLQEKIKPDNSKIIEGRMLSLRLNMNNQEDFVTKTENLAEAFRRSLVIEGMTPAKADELSIEKTIEVCRKNTSNDLVKATLESTVFTLPKDVIAKLITQADKVKKENQILAFSANNRQQKPQRFNRNNNSHPSGGNRVYYNSNTRPNGQFNNNNGQFNSHNGQYNRRRGWNNNNFQRRNNDQNFNNRNFNNQNNNFQRSNNRNNSYQPNPNRNRTIRVMSEAGNGEIPQQTDMGGERQHIEY